MKRDLLLDYIKLFAIVAVVMVHLPGTEELRRYVFPLNANATFAVIAGMYMLSGGSLGDWLRRRWHRLVLPYLAWELLYIAVGIAFDIVCHKFEMPSVRTVYQWVFWGGASTQLWFVATLFYVQLIFWLLAELVKKVAPAVPLVILWVPIAVVGIFGHEMLTPESNVRHLVFLGGYCALGACLRVPYEKLTRGIFLSERGSGICAYTMGVYLCHFLFTRVATMAYPHLLKVVPQVAAALIVTVASCGASFALVHFTKKRLYWLWGMSRVLGLGRRGKYSRV